MHEDDIDTLSHTIIPLYISPTVKREVDLAYYYSICYSLKFYGVAELSLKLLRSISVISWKFGDSYVIQSLIQQWMQRSPMP